MTCRARFGGRGGRGTSRYRRSLTGTNVVAEEANAAVGAAAADEADEAEADGCRWMQPLDAAGGADEGVAEEAAAEEAAADEVAGAAGCRWMPPLEAAGGADERVAEEAAAEEGGDADEGIVEREAVGELDADEADAAARLGGEDAEGVEDAAWEVSPIVMLVLWS